MTLSGSGIMAVLHWGEGGTRRGRGVLVGVLGIMRMRSAGFALYMVYVYRQKGRTHLYWVLVIGVNSVVAVGASEQWLTLQRLTLYWALGSNSGRYLDQYCKTRDRRLCSYSLPEVLGLLDFHPYKKTVRGHGYP